MSKDVNLGVEALKGFTGKLTGAALGFLGTILFARVLGPVGLGGFYFLLTIVHFVDRPIAGLAQAAKKRYSEVDAPEEEIFGALLLIGIGLVLLVGGTAFLIRDRLLAATNVEGAWLVLTSLMGAVTVFKISQNLLSGAGHIGVQTWNDTLRSVFTLVFQVLLVLVLATGEILPSLRVVLTDRSIGSVSVSAGSAGMGYGLALATVTVVPVALYFLRTRPAVPSRETFESLWRFARFSVLSAFVGKTQGRFDVLLIGGVIGAGVVGQYEVADRLTVPALFLAGVARSGLMTKVSNRHSRDVSYVKSVRNVLSYSSLLAVPLFFGALAVGRELVRTVYGTEFVAAAPLLVWLAAGQVFTTQASAYGATLNGIDDPRSAFRINVMTLVVNLGVGVALVFPYGALGVVAATVLADLFKLLLSVWTLRRRIETVPVVPSPLRRQLLAGAVMTVVVEAATRLLPIRSWVELSVVLVIGATSYFLLLTAVSGHFRTTVTDVVGEALLQPE